MSETKEAKPKRNRPISVYLNLDMREALEQSASDQLRDLSKQATVYILNGLKKDGYLTDPGVNREAIEESTHVDMREVETENPTYGEEDDG